MRNSLSRKKTGGTLHRREFLDRSARLGLGWAAGATILGNAPVRPRRAGRRQDCARADRRRRARRQFVRRLSPAAATAASPGLPTSTFIAPKPSRATRRRSSPARPPRPSRISAKSSTTRGGRRRHRHARPLARPGHGLGLPGRQGRVRGEAAHAQLLGRPKDGRGRPQVPAASCRWARRTAARRTTWRPRSTSKKGKLGKIHFCRVFNQKQWPNFPAVPDSDPPAGFDWDMFNGPAPQAAFNANFRRNWHHFWRLLRRRHHQRRHPSARPGPLAAGRRVSEVGLFDRAGDSTRRGRPKRPTRRWPSSISTACG